MEHATIQIDGTELEVVSARGEEAMSTLFRYDVVCVRGSAVCAPSELLGKSAELTLTAFEGQRRVCGIVAEAIAHAPEPAWTVVVRPPVFRLTVGRDSRVFHDASVVDIVKAVLARGQVPVRCELSESYPVRSYTAQFREADFAFVERLLAEEGVYYWFDHEAESCLVLGDRSSAAAGLAGGASLRVISDVGLRTASEVVFDLGSAGRATCDKLRLRSFDPARPSLELKQESGAASAAGTACSYDAPAGGPTEPAIMAARVGVASERAAASRGGLAGRTNSVRLTPGRALTVSGHAAPELDGSHVVTAVATTIAQRRRGEGGAVERALEVRFRAIPAAVAFRPPAPSPGALQIGSEKPRVAQALAARSGEHGAVGFQSGVVVGPPGNEVHPDSSGRVRLQLHWDREGQRDDQAGTWVRVAQRGTSGSLLLPRTGWNAMATCDEGKADSPALQARVVDAEHPPSYSLPAEKTKTSYRTATVPADGTTNEIRYESRAGDEEMFVHASRDFFALTQNAKTEAVVSNVVRDVAQDHSLKVQGVFAESLASNQAVTIKASESETVSGARRLQVTADASKQIGSNRSLKVGGSTQCSVSKGRSLLVGAAQIDHSLGSLQAAASSLQLLVGGARVKVTPKGITETVGTNVTLGTVAGKLGGVASAVAGLLPVDSVQVGGSLQAIGATKLELAGDSRAIAVGKSYQETVGGTMLLFAKELSDTAGQLLSLDVKDNLRGSATQLLVEATQSITIQCGEAKIELSSQGVTISAPTLDLSGATSVKAKGARIEQN